MADLMLLVIDGNSLAHRAFHAIPLLSTSQGIVTNAILGFTNMLLKILAQEQPHFVAVAFDKGKVTFRHDEFADYKAHRPATPDALRPQFPILKDLLQAMCIKVLEVEGYEADDIIGTVIDCAENKRITSLVLTGDRDILQLVSPLTKVLLTKKGISRLEVYDERKVCEEFGVRPDQFVDLRGLVGDPSDNIPGVPGIGEKTATRLLNDFGCLEQILEHASELPLRLQKQLLDFSEQARLAKRLSTISLEVPLVFDLADFQWQGPDYPRLLALLRKLEFKSLLRSLLDEDGKWEARKGGLAGLPPLNIETYSVSYYKIEKIDELNCLQKEICKAGRAALALKEINGKGLAFALAVDLNQTYHLFIENEEESKQIGQFLCWLCENDTIQKFCYNGKKDYWLLRSYGFTLINLGFDVMVASYLLNPAFGSGGRKGFSDQDFRDLALEQLGIILPASGEVALPARVNSILKLADTLAQKLKLQEEEQLFYEVELPLVEILAEMEVSGLKVDLEQLKIISVELNKQIKVLVNKIYGLTGEDFNINSPKQLGKILFEKLSLPVVKKTKTGYSTDATTLEELADSHQVVAKILEYRQLTKLKSTYVDGLARAVNPVTGNLHTTFNQTVTSTGRLSSMEPNLQNIPVHVEQGRKIRKVFIPRCEGNLLLGADYSQIELRILAHMAEDPYLLEAFSKGQDIHVQTAAEVFGVPLEEVTGEMRGKAKAINFGIVYGISDFGLARELKISRVQARRYIDSYFKRYFGVKEYIERMIREAREKGYVTTLLNRRRYLPELFSPDRSIRSFGERTAINTPIQGSAADIIKLAMVRIHKEIARCQLKALMVLQVHDELIFDVPGEEVEELKDLVKEYMENAVTLKVPLIVDVKVGPNWHDMGKVI